MPYVQQLNMVPYSLIGWSDGGATALWMAHKWRASVRSVVTLGVTAYITEAMTQIYRSKHSCL